MIDEGVTGSHRHEDLVVRGPDGEPFLSVSYRSHGSKAEAKTFVRRINEVARSQAAGDHA